MLKKLTFILLCPVLLLAQEGETDQQVWGSLTYKLDITKDLRFEIEGQSRYSNMAGGINQYFPEFGFRYELTDNFDIKPQYRFKVLPTELRNVHRISIDFSYTFDYFNNFRLGSRIRIQDETAVYTKEKENTARWRIELGYNLTKLVDPYVEYELHYEFQLYNLSKIRYTAGLEWKLNDRFDLDTFWRYDQDKKGTIIHESIFGIGLTYSMDWDDFGFVKDE